MAGRLPLCPIMALDGPQEAGITSVSPLKYLTTASPLLLAAVLMWNLRPRLFLQWKRISVKCKCFLSSFVALFVSTISLLFTTRYEDLTGNWVEDEHNTLFSYTSLLPLKLKGRKRLLVQVCYCYVVEVSWRWKCPIILVVVFVFVKKFRMVGSSLILLPR